MKFNICVAVPITSGDLERNEEVLKNVLDENPEFVELRFDYIEDIQQITPIFVKSLLDLIESQTKAIFTFRDFSEGGQIELAISERLKIIQEGVKIIEKFKEELVNNYAVDFISIKKIIFKLIFTAQRFEDNIIPMKICKDLLEKNKDKNVISFCMGELGIFSRIMCVIAGSFLTYASLEERTAPGQINIRKMSEILQTVSNNY